MNRILRYSLMAFMGLMMTCVISLSTANAQIGPVIRVVAKRAGSVAKPVFNEGKKAADWGVQHAKTGINKAVDVIRRDRGPIIIGNDRNTTIQQQHPRPRAGGRVWGDLRGH